MSEVWLGEDTRLGRKVALKVLRAELTSGTQKTRWLANEAGAASALNHPNIVTVYDIVEHSGRSFIASEYVEGMSLRARLNRGRLTPAEAATIAKQIAFALSAAHNAGVIHRDVKPENVMLRPDGLVKLLDFGIAKRVERADFVGEQPTATLPGAVRGSVAYLSPEQARGLPVDARTDVWSLGVVLYEMLCGERPFKGATAGETIEAILEREPVPLARCCPDISAVLQAIVSKALLKDPQKRLHSPTVAELLQVNETIGSAGAWAKPGFIVPRIPSKLFGLSRRQYISVIAGAGGLTRAAFLGDTFGRTAGRSGGARGRTNNGGAGPDPAVDSVKLLSISPHPDTPLRVGQTVTFKVEVEYKLASAVSGAIQLVIQQRDPPQALASEIEVVAKGRGRVVFIRDVLVPETTAVMVGTPLRLQSGPPGLHALWPMQSYKVIK